MRLLILDIDGMLGHVLKSYFESLNYDVATYSPDVDSIYSVEEEIMTFKPDVVVNCAAVLIKESEEKPRNAILINSFLPHYLDHLSNKHHFKLIHRSTDCVFEGKSGDYTEKSVPDATSFYGRTKALGEINNDHVLTLRVSIIGPNEHPDLSDDLLSWFSGQNGVVHGYTKVFWTGITTQEFARIIETSINNNLTGLHNVTNGQKISKADLLRLFNNHFSHKKEIVDDDSKISDKSLSRTNTTYDFNIPEYEVMINEMFDWINDNQETYKSLIERIKQ
jgi:dTDP-4-dehydrorhamnose reductase